jgi:hypothetical protein
VDVIARNHVVQDGQTKALLSLEEPVQITPSIARELQEKLSLMAAVRDVPDVSGQKIAVGARHRFFLEAHFQAPKEASTLLNNDFYCMVNC